MFVVSTASAADGLRWPQTAVALVRGLRHIRPEHEKTVTKLSLSVMMSEMSHAAEQPVESSTVLVHQYCSVLFAVLLYIVLSRLGQNNPATIFVTKSMAGLTNSCGGFAYRIERTEKGGFVLHITNATAILVCSAENGDVEVDLSLCPAICPNLPYTEIFVSYAINDEPIIVRMQSGPKGDLWIREDGPTHP